MIGVDATNLVVILNSVEDAGLIQRSRDRADRRRAIITISRQGERRLAELDRALGQLDDEILAPLTHSEREMLKVLLTRAVMHIGAECANAHDAGCHS
jgi:DNA-binding MarR family transcriptional regulator